MGSNVLTQEERKVIDALADAWNAFVSLPEEHEWERVEFMHAIHAAQSIVMARPAQRELNEGSGGAE